MAADGPGSGLIMAKANSKAATAATAATAAADDDTELGATAPENTLPSMQADNAERPERAAPVARVPALMNRA